MTWQVPDPLPPTITVRATAMCAECGPTGGTAFNAGVRVRVCSTADPECLAELTSGDTDSTGSVALTFTTQNNPASVFLAFHKDGWLDDLLMLDTPPLSYNFDVGVVHMDTWGEVDQLTRDLNVTPAPIYDPALALVKVRVGDCNLQRSTGIDLTWGGGAEGATIVPLSNSSDWDAIAVNLPVPANETTRLVARRAMSASPDVSTGLLVASANLVVRRGAITLAPFVTPTP